MIKPPPLRNDCFALPPGVDWTPVDQALDLLQNRLHPVAAVETTPVAQAAGRVLAQNITAARSHPPVANTAVDGYGFAGGLGDGPHILPLAPGRAAAGQRFDGAVPPGHAIRVLTGAALPHGVDTVVLDEDVTATPTHIALNGPLKQGANTRRAGEDVAQGADVLPQGRRLTPPDLGLLCATGIAQVPTYRPLTVAILSTGSELSEPGGQQGSDTQTYDANRPMLITMLERWGLNVLDLGIIPDDASLIATALGAGAAGADAIITSGGASAGDEDHISRLLNTQGTMAAWRIALKPGRPLALGLWGGTPVFGLPGNPVAAWVCSLVFVRPALQLLGGAGFTHPAGFSVPAGFSKSKKPGRREYLRARMGADGRVAVFGSEGSGRISGLSWSTGLVELPDGAMTVAPGDPVKFIPYSEFGL